jgi:hypothetical protein
MKRVLLATITENDQCYSTFANSLVQTVRVGLHNQVEILPIFYPSLGNWAMAANQAMTLACQEELDGMFLVSPSVSWDPAQLIEVFESDKDAMAIPVATRGGFHVTLGEIARLQEDDKTGEIKVGGASLDLFYMSAYALKQLCDTHPEVVYQGQNVKLILQSGDIYSSYHTHEEVLAYRLRELGIELWVNPSHTAVRRDTVDYNADFATVLNQLKEDG